MQEAVRDRLPPFGVIRGAMGAVWLGFFLAGLRRKVDKMGKVTKKGSLKIVGREFLEVGLRPKKRSSNIFGPPPPPFQMSKYATAGAQQTVSISSGLPIIVTDVANPDNFKELRNPARGTNVYLRHLGKRCTTSRRCSQRKKLRKTSLSVPYLQKIVTIFQRLNLHPLILLLNIHGVGLQT
jgi:hypothetical protein